MADPQLTMGKRHLKSYGTQSPHWRLGTAPQGQAVGWSPASPVGAGSAWSFPPARTTKVSEGISRAGAAVHGGKVLW